ESVPGLKRLISSAGHAGFASDQVVTSAEKIIASSSSVNPSPPTQSLGGYTTIASASVPSRTSTDVRPIAAQLSISLSLIGRDAFATSVAPAVQKRSNPAPDPMLSIVMFPAYPSAMKRSAIRSASG